MFNLVYVRNIKKVTAFGAVFLALALGLGLATGCKTIMYEEPIPGPSTSIQEVYPLNVAFEAGLTGTATLVKLEDGTALLKASIVGMQPGFTYWGNISAGSTSLQTGSPILMDMKQFINGYSETWLFEDYLNRKVLYDSLIKMDAHIRVLARNTVSPSYKPVLRGDIGSNLLTNTTRTLDVTSFGGSNVIGSIILRERRSGKLLAKTSLTGLEPGAFVPVRLFRGSIDDPASSTAVITLNPISQSIDFSESDVAGLPGGLAGFDTFNGYFAVGYSTGQPDSIIAVSLLGNNRPTGRKDSVTLFTADSTVQVKVVLVEFPGNVWKPTITAGNLIGNGPFFLSLHANSVVNEPPVGRTALGVSRILIQAGKRITGTALRFGNRLWTSDSLRTGDYHLRVDPDTGMNGFSGNDRVPTADIGGNAITSNFLRLALQPEPLTPDFTGTLLLRKRINGKVLFRVMLDNTTRGNGYDINLRLGAHMVGDPNPVPGAPLYLLKSIETSGSTYETQFEPTTGGPLNTPLFYDFFSAGKFFEFYSTDDLITTATANIQ
jgi:hypothetical protein